MSDPTNNSDNRFLTHFAISVMVVLFLVIFIALIAHTFGGSFPSKQGMVSAQTEDVATRIAPVADVYAGATGRAAQAKAEAEAKKAAESEVAYGGTTDGKEVFGHLCTNCHTDGIAGAPKVGNKDDWKDRIAEGEDTLVKHAIEGYTGPDGNTMPPKGGNPALTDEQVKNTVKWMMSQVD